MLAVCRGMMRRIALVAIAGDFEVALSRYKAFASFFKDSEYLFRKAVGGFPAVVQVFVAHYYSYWCDLHCAMAAINTRLTKYKDAKENTDACIGFRRQNQQARSCSTHLHFIASLAEYDGDERVSVMRACLRQKIGILEGLPVKDSGILHDIAILKEAPGMSTDESVQSFVTNTIVPRISTNTLPLPTYDSHAAALALHPIPDPQHLVDWQDVVHLAELSSEEEERIDAMKQEMASPSSGS